MIVFVEPPIVIETKEGNVERLGKWDWADRFEVCDRLISIDLIITILQHSDQMRYA